MQEMIKIGAGAESQVFRHPHIKDRAIKLSREGARPEQVIDVKARFYLTRIMRLFFPQMLPVVHLEARKNQQTRIECQLIQLEQDYLKIMELLSLSRSMTDQEFEVFTNLYDAHVLKINENDEIAKFLEFMDQSGMSRLIDDTPINFGFTPKGKAVYLDRVKPRFVDLSTLSQEEKPIERETLSQVILKLPLAEQARAFVWMDRYYKLLNYQSL